MEKYINFKNKIKYYSIITYVKKITKTDDRIIKSMAYRRYLCRNVLINKKKLYDIGDDFFNSKHTLSGCFFKDFYYLI